MDPVLLRRRWRSVTGRPAPPRLPVSLMIRILMWQEQIAQVGNIDPACLARLNACVGTDPGGPVETLDAASQPGKRPSLYLRPGTVLVREHAGALHRVMVLTEGFAWNGQTYPSLSRVARAITGTSWNGPRFFGLGKTRLQAMGGDASLDHGEGAPPERSGEAP